MNLVLPDMEERRVNAQTEKKIWEESTSDIKAGLHATTMARINFMPGSTLVKHYGSLSAEHIKIHYRNTSKVVKIGVPLSSICYYPDSFAQWRHIIAKQR